MLWRPPHKQLNRFSEPKPVFFTRSGKTGPWCWRHDLPRARTHTQWTPQRVPEWRSLVWEVAKDTLPHLPYLPTLPQHCLPLQCRYPSRFSLIGAALTLNDRLCLAWRRCLLLFWRFLPKYTKLTTELWKLSFFLFISFLHHRLLKGACLLPVIYPSNWSLACFPTWNTNHEPLLGCLAISIEMR